MTAFYYLRESSIALSWFISVVFRSFKGKLFHLGQFLWDPGNWRYTNYYHIYKMDSIFTQYIQFLELWQSFFSQLTWAFARCCFCLFCDNFPVLLVDSFCPPLGDFLSVALSALAVLTFTRLSDLGAPYQFSGFSFGIVCSLFACCCF